MDDSPAPGCREFTTTHWSVVEAAGAKGDLQEETRARDALAELCRIYWYPLYSFVRNQGSSPHDAEDLTQAFFARLIETGGFSGAERGRGRFRSWLLGSMKHFLANDWHRKRTWKRGGRAELLEWDALDAESRYRLDPAEPGDPESIFDREWARETIRRVLDLLRADWVQAGKGTRFEDIQDCLAGAGYSLPDTAARLGISEGAAKVAVYRLRQQFRQTLRAEIGRTVSHPSEIEEEMRHLVNALRGNFL